MTLIDKPLHHMDSDELWVLSKQIDQRLRRMGESKPTVYDTPLTHEQARKLFDYNPDTGEIRWRNRPREDFATRGSWLRWNSMYSGKIAGNWAREPGWLVSISGKTFCTKNVLFPYMDRPVPNYVGYHRYRDLSWGSLIPRSTVRARPGKGVYWDKRVNRWRAALSKKHIGLYRCKTAALVARKQAELKFGVTQRSAKP